MDQGPPCYSGLLSRLANIYSPGLLEVKEQAVNRKQVKIFSIFNIFFRSLYPQHVLDKYLRKKVGLKQHQNVSPL